MECEKRIEKLDWNTKFYHPAKFELKRIKNAKVVPRMHFFASYICPPCDSILNFIAKSLQPVINVHSSHYADVNGFLNPSIITCDNYCPDLLLLIRSTCLYVLELTVGFESYLNNNAVRKKEKYLNLIKEISDV